MLLFPLLPLPLLTFYSDAEKRCAMCVTVTLQQQFIFSLFFIFFFFFFKVSDKIHHNDLAYCSSKSAAVRE